MFQACVILQLSKCFHFHYLTWLLPQPCDINREDITAPLSRWFGPGRCSDCSVDESQYSILGVWVEWAGKLDKSYQVVLLDP